MARVRRKRIFLCAQCGGERWLRDRPEAASICKPCSEQINIRIAQQSKPGLKHGGYGTRLYGIWRGMKTRCSPTAKARARYHRFYADRGVRVCTDWMSSFEAFRDWSMSHGYAENLELDRENPDEGYSPENCRWVTHHENCMNQRGKCAAKPLGIRPLIVALRDSGRLQRDVAREFGVDQSYVSRLWKGARWAVA